MLNVSSLLRVSNTFTKVSVNIHISVSYFQLKLLPGHDKTSMILGDGDNIKQYLDSRYVSAPEAHRRLYEFRMHEEVPNSQML